VHDFGTCKENAVAQCRHPTKNNNKKKEGEGKKQGERKRKEVTYFFLSWVTTQGEKSGVSYESQSAFFFPQFLLVQISFLFLS